MCAQECITWVSYSISLKHFYFSVIHPITSIPLFLINKVFICKLNKFCIQELLEHQETFSSPIIPSMRNLPSLPTSVIKTILPKPQIMVIAVSLPIELFNKKSGAMGDSYFGSYLNQHGKKDQMFHMNYRNWVHLKLCVTQKIYLNSLHILFQISLTVLESLSQTC